MAGGNAADDTVWRNDGTGGFVDSGQRLGGGPGYGGVELGDLDRDGDLDAFVACGSPVPGAPVKLFRNDMATAARPTSWGQVKCHFTPAG